MNNINYLDVAYQGRNKWWHYAIFLVATSFFVSCFAVIILIIWIQIFSHLSLLDILKKGEITRIIRSMPRWESLTISILANSFGCLCIIAGVKKIHRRSFISIICPDNVFNTRYYFKAFIVWLLISLLFKVLQYIPNHEAIKLVLNPSEWLICLVPAIILACVSAFIKEVIRGYILQGLGLIFRYLLPLIIISSFLSSVTSGILNEHQCTQLQCITYDFIYDFIYSAGLAIFILKENSLESVLGIHTAGILIPIFIHSQSVGKSFPPIPSIFIADFGVQQYLSLVNVSIIFLLIKLVLFYSVFLRKSTTLIL